MSGSPKNIDLCVHSEVAVQYSYEALTRIGW